jgi:hypothetical protein
VRWEGQASLDEPCTTGPPPVVFPFFGFCSNLLGEQDTNTDNCASDYYENETTYCVCMVFGLYLN